jgi:D-2-hydroxyglutarate dehydrogenase
MRQYKGESPVLVAPRTPVQVSAVLKYCNDNRLGVVPQGGNTGLVGGSVPIADEVILSLSKLNAVISFDPISGVLVCEAGCILEHLDAFLAPHGFAMPLDLGAKGSCQIGGNVATNAGGLRFLRYGSLHGSVLGLEVVTADGRMLDMLSCLKKDNVGYDAKQLFIGSEGTLGVITKGAIQAVPKTSRQVAMLLAPSYAACADLAALARRHLGEILSAVEMVDGHAMSVTTALLHGYGKGGAASGATDGASAALAGLPEDMRPAPYSELLAEGHSATLGTPDRFYVVIETGGSNHEHDNAKLAAFLETCMAAPAPTSSVGGGAQFGAAVGPLVLNGVVAADETQAAFLWRLREEVSVALSQRGHVFKYDLSFSTPDMYGVVQAARSRMRDSLPAMQARIRAEAARAGVDAEEALAQLAGTFPVGYGHMFDGNIHLNVTCPTRWIKPAPQAHGSTESPPRSSLPSCHAAMLHTLEPWVFKHTMERAGSISAEHGVGQAKAHYLPAARSPAVWGLMRTLKQSLDPNGILNPGKVIEVPLVRAS